MTEGAVTDIDISLPLLDGKDETQVEAQLPDVIWLDLIINDIDTIIMLGKIERLLKI